jgi:hypothetical protein
MAGRFVVTRNGRDTFLEEEELKREAARGLVGVGDLVYHPVLGRWLYAREVEEIRAEMGQAATLGRPAPLPIPLDSNAEAIAGFVLGVLGHLPLVGFVFCLLGIFFSSRGLKRASQLANRGHGLAVAGMVLSIVFLVPATACSAMFFAGLMS